tara:strand:+ start:312 stop:500 length:189 start_codon:yes stop_codon:yes gene_type:complete
MPDLRIQANIDNGDLPKDCDKMSQAPSAQLELFEDQKPKQISLFDIFTPERLKEFFAERDNK